MTQTRTVFEKKRVFLLELLVMFVWPVWLLHWRPDLTFLRYVLMGIGLLEMVVMAWYLKLNHHDFGLHRQGLRKSVIGAGLFTAMGTILLWLVFDNTSLTHFLMIPSMQVFKLPVWLIITSYVMLSVPLQELVFRSLVIKRLALLKLKPNQIIVLSASLFALAHIIFGSSLLLMMCFVAGLVWGWLYVKYQNLWAIQMSHAVLGSLVIWLALH